jgi:hypothetical protein
MVRTGLIAVAVGGVLAVRWGGIARWPLATLLALWISFGGHWVELWFLNWLRPLIPASRGAQILTRLAVWFVGGIVLAFGMQVTAMAFGLRPMRWSAWWIAGVAFVGIELMVHLVILMRGRSSFYSGRG